MDLDFGKVPGGVLEGNFFSFDLTLNEVSRVIFADSLKLFLGVFDDVALGARLGLHAFTFDAFKSSLESLFVLGLGV